jgi:hypothetical protein
MASYNAVLPPLREHERTPHGAKIRRQRAPHEYDVGERDEGGPVVSHQAVEEYVRRALQLR